MDEITALRQRIEELETVVNKLRADATIPYEIGEAFNSRLRIDDLAKLASSAKVATSEDQAVNEAGAGTYNVLKSPDGFREYTVGSQTFYFPYYT